ncbi:hypothetical protein AB0904_03500 [Streptomyces sp. NPDC006684]|uniref:hypothetical protein n=1 Tax=Streptomyces sp. NPDC006684 TaxID=3154477 RepID=UPI0034553B7C
MPDRSARPSLRTAAPAGAAAGAPLGVLPTAFRPAAEDREAARRPVFALREGGDSSGAGSGGTGASGSAGASGARSGGTGSSSGTTSGDAGSSGAGSSGTGSSGTGSSGAGADAGSGGTGSTPGSGEREEPGTRGGPEAQSEPDNPFAAPPADRPDQPWRPRAPEGGGTRWSGQQPEPWRGGGWGNRPGTPPQGQDQGSQGQGQGQQGQGQGQGPQGPWQGPGQGGPQQGPGQGPGNGNGGPGGPFPRIPRWDPTDPVQRHARYALMAGTWGLVLGLFLGWTYLALLLGALGLYWGISALRGRARTPQESEAALRAVAKGNDPEEAATRAREEAAKHPAQAPPTPYVRPVTRTRPQVPSAVTGIVTSALSIAAVAAVFLFHGIYSDYFTCVDDAATHASRDACENHLPKELRPLLAE